MPTASEISGTAGNPPPSLARLPELDGLRGLAIGLVLLYHYFQLTLDPLPGSLLSYFRASFALGWTGVDLFFVLSGFLIGGILMDARNSTNYFQVFYKRRFFRIVPLYAVILLFFPALVSVAQSMHRGDFTWLSAHPMPRLSYWTFTQNLWMAHRGTFGGNTLAVTWSLSIEEQFYLTLPLLVRFLSPRWLLRCVLIGIYTAPLLRIALDTLLPGNWLPAYVLMPCRADALLLGVLAAILLRDPLWKERFQRGWLFWSIAFPVLLLGIVLIMWKHPAPFDPVQAAAGYTWMALFYASVLVFSLSRSESLLARALRMKWLAWLGSIAYGAYLIHQMIQGMLFGFARKDEPAITGGYTFLISLLALALTLVLARLSWRFFESPLVRFGHRFKYEFAGSAPNSGLKEMRAEEGKLVCP